MISRAIRQDGVPEDVRVLRVDLDFAVPLSDPLFDALSSEERDAAARFRRAEDRVRSAATRAVLRRELGTALGEAPSSLRFVRSERGRPALRDAAPRLDFNVAHGGDHALLAWSPARRVGVDVEPLRPGWDWRRLASMALGGEDARRIALGEGEAERAALFLDAWAAKEALLKADGRGIADGMAGFSVLSGEPDIPRVDGPGALADALRRFAARWIRSIPGHAACVAWRREPGLHGGEFTPAVTPPV